MAILPALFIIGGCDTARLAFDQIGLGQQMPADNMIRKAGTTQPDQVSWSDFGGIPLPAMYGIHDVGVITDASGNVIAKRYKAVAMGHWLLAQTWAFRTVLDVQVPAAALPSRSGRTIVVPP